MRTQTLGIAGAAGPRVLCLLPAGSGGDLAFDAAQQLSAHDSADSRYPSASAMSSLRPSARTPIITSRHSLCSSSRMFT